MTKLNELITKNESALNLLQDQKKELQYNMADPNALSTNAKKIQEVEKKVSLLKDGLELAEDMDSDISAKEVMEEMKNHFEEMKSDIDNNEMNPQDRQKMLGELEKDIAMTENIVSNDLANSSSTEELFSSSDSFDDF